MSLPAVVWVPDPVLLAQPLSSSGSTGTPQWTPPGHPQRSREDRVRCRPERSKAFRLTSVARSL